jgi:hypothetical protein
MQNQEHVIKLCLSPAMHLALIKYQAKHELGRPYAGLSLLAKSLHSEGFLSKEDYEVCLLKYSHKLVEETPKPLTFEGLKQKQKLNEKTRYFQAILAGEWRLHESLEWRRKVLILAQEWKDQIPAAKMVIDLGGGQLILNVGSTKQKELGP